MFQTVDRPTLTEVLVDSGGLITKFCIIKWLLQGRDIDYWLLARGFRY